VAKGMLDSGLDSSPSIVVIQMPKICSHISKSRRCTQFHTSNTQPPNRIIETIKISSKE
jgi:hypothetical protein